ncbi:MAG: hypothetical protein ACRDZY_11980, partial [Acidimicrobiales bacterium]
MVTPLVSAPLVSAPLVAAPLVAAPLVAAPLAASPSALVVGAGPSATVRVAAGLGGSLAPKRRPTSLR